MSFSAFLKFFEAERTFYYDLARHPKLDDPQLTYEDLLGICEKIMPSVCLRTGGLMFESFVIRFGIRRHRECLLEGKLESKVRAEIIRSYTMLFWFEVVTKVVHINRKANTPLFLVTLALEYRGLSRLGIQFLAFCGVATNPRTYDRKRTANLGSYGTYLQSLLSIGGYLIPFDNYCHQYFMPRIETKRDKIMLQTNCTVVAISVTPTIVDTRFVRAPNGVVYPSIPPKKVILFRYLRNFVAELKNSLCDIGDRTGDNYTYWPIARVVRDNVRRIPAQLDQPNPQDENKNHDRGLKNFKPWFVSPDHPASNQGTANIMTRIYKECKQVLQHSYILSRMDVDPWMKWLRVISLSLSRFLTSLRLRLTAKSSIVTCSCSVRVWSSFICLNT